MKNIRISCGACCRSIASDCLDLLLSLLCEHQTDRKYPRADCMFPRTGTVSSCLPGGTVASGLYKSTVIKILQCFSPALLQKKEHSSGIIQCRWEASPVLIFFVKLHSFVIIWEETVMGAERLGKMRDVEEGKNSFFKARRT